MIFWYTSSVSDSDRERLHSSVLRSLQAAIASCDAVPELPHFRRPPAKIPIHDLFSDFNDESDPEIFDVLIDGFPWGLSSNELISMVWYSICTSISMRFATIQLGQETTLFFEFNDSEADHLHFVATVTGLSAELAHESFLGELFRSNGATFNTGVFGSPPNEITSILPRSKLVEPFLAAADCAVENGCGDFWEEVLQLSSRRPQDPSGIEIDVFTQNGRRKAVEAYLASLLP